MTVQSGINRADHVGNNVTTSFAYDFPVLDEAHMQVYVDSIRQVGGYTVTGVGNPAGGTVDFATAPAAVPVTLLRLVPLTQLKDYIELGPFPSASHEQALDLGVMGTQQVDELQQRTQRYPVAEQPDELALTLPSVADRQGKYAAYDGFGNPIAAEAPGPGGVPISDWGKTWITLTGADQGRQELQSRRFRSVAGTPSTTDDVSQGYAVDDLWLDNTTSELYVCLSAAAGAANWQPYGPNRLARIATYDLVQFFPGEPPTSGLLYFNRSPRSLLVASSLTGGISVETPPGGGSWGCRFESFSGGGWVTRATCDVLAGESYRPWTNVGGAYTIPPDENMRVIVNTVTASTLPTNVGFTLPLTIQ